MQINNLQKYGIYSNKNHTNFKQTKSENQLTFQPAVNLNRKEKTAAAAGCGLLAAAVSIAAAFKNRKFVKGFNKIFRPNKNMLQEASFLKGVDLREYYEKRFIDRFIDPIKKRAQGYIMPNTGEKYNGFPSNGYLICGSESKAKDDFYEWTIKELEKAGAQIIDPKPGGKPKYDDVRDAWHNLFWDSKNGINPDTVEEQFKKDGKFKVFVVRGIDELGEPVKKTVPSERMKKRFEELKASSAEIREIFSEKNLKNPNRIHKKHNESFLNDLPDTNDCAEKYGLILSYKAKDTTHLDPGTIRTGRTDMRISILPYANESVEVWKNHLENVKSHSAPSVIVRTIETAKEIFAKRGEKDFNEIKPYLEYDLPYEGLTLKAPLKKWKNWIEYMGSRKGVSDEMKFESIATQLGMIGGQEGTGISQAACEKLKANPKFKKILDMMYEQYIKLVNPPTPKENWELLVNSELRGFAERV